MGQLPIESWNNTRFENDVHTYMSTQILASPIAQRLIQEPGEDCVVAGESIIAYFGANSPSWLLLTCLAAYLSVAHVASYVALLLSRHHHKT